MGADRWVNPGLSGALGRRDIYYRIDLQGRIQEISPSVAAVTGYQPEELQGREVTEAYLSADLRERVVGALVAHGELEQVEIPLRLKDGSVRWFSANANLVRDEAGAPIGVEGIARDVTEHRAADQALAASEQRYRLLVENAPLGVLSIDREGRIVDLNQKLVEMLGSPSAEATRAINLLSFPPLVEAGIAADFQRCLERGEAIVGEHPYRSRWGVEVHVRYHLQPTRDADGRVDGVHAIVEDVGAIRRAEAETRRLEDQLREAQKMEAIGQLAGGVAHDMNNILGTILGLASVLQVELAGDDSCASELAAIVDACKKGRDLTRNLLGFARRGKYLRQRVALNALAGEVKLLLERTVSKKIVIRADLDPALDDVEGDPGQLNQALMNICLNAVDAIRDKGTITIRTRNAPHTPGPELKSGPHVELSVIDTGVGVDPEALDHVFEPFFTTKPPGKGTGLGLAMVYGTIRNHGGTVEMESEPGRGTTVTILLPALPGLARESSAPVIEPIAPRRAAGTALLVDDEAGFREAGSRMLEVLGYKVLTAAHGAEAVQLFSKRHRGINLVVLDMIMPVMDGVETFDRLRAIDAAVPVLLASGYAQEAKADALLGRGAVGFLQKPFDVETLARELARLA